MPDKFTVFSTKTATSCGQVGAQRRATMDSQRFLACHAFVVRRSALVAHDFRTIGPNARSDTLPATVTSTGAAVATSGVIGFPFTVREVVALGHTSRSGNTAADRHRALDDALSRVGLGGFGGRLFQDLSGGEQQRVHLARVLCQVPSPVEDGDARALFLDEPTTSLDIRHQVEVLSIARGFADAGGMVFANLHDLNLGTGFADRYLVLERGRIVLAGTPSDVLVSPRLAEVFGLALDAHHRAGDGFPIVMPAVGEI